MTAVVFDLDGTLIDSAPDIHASANRSLAHEGLAPLSLPQVKGFIGKGVAHLISRLLDASGQPDLGPQHARMVAHFTENYETAVTLTTCYPGALLALAALRQAGHPLGLCTNKPVRATHAVLRHLNMGQYFGAVYGGDSLPQRKPDPAPLHATLAALGGGTGIYVGDSETDAATAQAAGVPFLLFTEGYRKSPVRDLPHTAAFSDFAELPGLVASLSRECDPVQRAGPVNP